MEEDPESSNSDLNLLEVVASRASGRDYIARSDDEMAAAKAPNRNEAKQPGVVESFSRPPNKEILEEDKYFQERKSALQEDQQAKDHATEQYWEDTNNDTGERIESNDALPMVSLERGHRQTRPSSETSKPGAFPHGGGGLLLDSPELEAEAQEPGLDPECGPTEGLLVAQQVDCADDFSGIQQADDVDLEATARRQQDTKRLKRNILLGIIAILIVVVIVISLVTSSKDDPIPLVTLSPTNPPTLAPTNYEGYLIGLLPEVALEPMGDPFSPQARAYDWLVQDMQYHQDNGLSETRILQRFILVSLYYSTGGERWVYQDNWLSHTDECDWERSPYFHAQPVFYIYGPYLDDFFPPTEPLPPACDTDGAYQHLWLDANNLDGTLPDELYAMTSLKTFSSVFNTLYGTISSEIGLLTNMEGFAIMNTKPGLGPSIPTEVGLLSDLEVFSISNLDLHGTMPSEFWQLTKLSYFNIIYSPHLKGTLPTEVGLMMELRWLSWSVCDFSGTIPSEVGLLSHLVFVGIGGNIDTMEGRMEGAIPTELGQLPNLQSLSLRDAMFTGTIPSELGLLQVPVRIGIYNGLLTGTIPTELGMTNMDWLLRFDNNLLSGEIPSELGRLSGVRDLDIKFNQMSGQIPSQLGLVNFTWFDFQNNSFTGSIPPELASLWSSLHTFNVQSNSGLTGVVPNELCDLNGTCITNDGHLCPGESGMKFDCTESLCGCDCECGSR